MALTADVTLDNIYGAIAAYLTSVTGLSGTQIQRAYQDNIPTPFPYPFVYITVRNNRRNATNEHAYDTTNNKVGISASKILDVQLDFYGQTAMNLAQIVENTFRDDAGVTAFENTGIVPLYCDEALMSANTDEKGNFMVRVTQTLHFNMHPVVSTAQDFFEAAVVNIKNAEQQGD